MAKSILLEKHVQQTVTQFLEWDGWRAIRTDPVSDRSRGKGFGEVSMPDALFIRYWAGEGGDDPNLAMECERATASVLWCEFKRPGQKPRKDQLAWHEAERARGALVRVVDDPNQFFEWYEKSGLQRRVSVPRAVNG